MPDQFSMTVPAEFMRSVLLRDGRWYTGTDLYISEEGIALEGGEEPINVPWLQVVGMSALPMVSGGGPITNALNAAAKQVNGPSLAVHLRGQVTKRKKLTFSDGRTATVEEVEL